MIIFSAPVLTALCAIAGLAQSSPSASSSAKSTSSALPLPICTTTLFPVTVSNVQQKNMTSLLNPLKFNGTYAGFPDTVVNGTYNISASLCGPSVHVGNRRSTLQVLLHGATYTKTYWSGLEVPPNSFNGSTYSWVDYAASQGYSTLVLDRLCNGNSSHPDGANVCQLPVEAATIHSLIESARQGTLLPGSGTPAFTKIVLVAHSLGSILGAYYVNKYSSDVDGLILTGYSIARTGDMSLQVGAGVAPAKLIDPARFGALDNTYLAFAVEAGARNVLYYGGYSENVAAMDFATRGTVTFGEEYSTQLLTPPRNYSGNVFIMNGEHDQVLCATAAVDALYGTGADCTSSNITSLTSLEFPAAKSFGYFNQPDAGHDITLHYSAKQGFAAAHAYLAKQGY